MIPRRRLRGGGGGRGVLVGAVVGAGLVFGHPQRAHHRVLGADHRALHLLTRLLEDATGLVLASDGGFLGVLRRLGGLLLGGAGGGG